MAAAAAPAAEYTLYYSPGACSLASHIALLTAGLPYKLVKVDLRTKKTEGGEDYLAVNAKGAVPALRLPTGEVLTEGPAVLGYIADLAPSSGLAPAAGTLARARVQEALGYLNSDLHKAFGPLFNPAVPAVVRDASLATIAKVLAYLDTVQLADGRKFLTGAEPTIADYYFYVILSWCPHVKVDATPYPRVAAVTAAVAALPKVHAALVEEGLAK